jgi:hypothetical protein
MSKYDWDLWTAGSYEINQVASYSIVNSLRNVTGVTRLFWNSNSNLTNVGVTAQVKQEFYFNNNNRFALFTRLSTMGVYSPSQPVYGGYWMRCYCTNATTGNLSFEFFRAKLGLNTTLVGVQNYLIPGIGTNWLKIRFSVRDEFGMPVLRLERWNGTTLAWVTMYEYQDASVNTVFSGGFAGFGFDRNDNASSLYFDDVVISSFA